MKKIQLTFFLLFLSFTVFSQISLTEKQALLDLYTATNGDQWKNSWDLETPISEWNGVTLKNNKVIGIHLLFNNLEGELPKSIGQLMHLENLELSFNKLKGTIPTEIGNLRKLRILAFNGNNLTGTIPASIGKISSLTQLHISSNQLTGELPSTVANLKYLEVLNVFDNDLSGRIPTELANSKNLKQVMVAENNFEDTNIFSAELLSNGATIKLEQPFVIPKSKEVIAIESEDEN